MPTQKWTCEQCGASFDSFQAASDCERSHKSRSKGYRVSTTTHTAKAIASEDTSVYLIHASEQEGLRWGCHINICNSYEISRYPEWVKSLPFSSSWGDRGLVIWDETIRTVARMRAADALELLADLQANPIGAVTIVGTRNIDYSHRHNDQKPRYKLVNKISLDIAQAHELLRFLQVNEPLLQKLAAEDKERGDQALRQVYRILIRSYMRRQAEECAQSQS